MTDWKDTARRLVACAQWRIVPGMPCMLSDGETWIAMWKDEPTGWWDMRSVELGFVASVNTDQDIRLDLTNPALAGVLLDVLKSTLAGSYPKLSLEYDADEWCCWVSWTSDPADERGETCEFYAQHAAEAVALALLHIWESTTATEG